MKPLFIVFLAMPTVLALIFYRFTLAKYYIAFSVPGLSLILNKKYLVGIVFILLQVLFFVVGITLAKTPGTLAQVARLAINLLSFTMIGLAIYNLYRVSKNKAMNSDTTTSSLS